MTDYHPLIARAVASLPQNTDTARRALYDRARNALLAKLRSNKPPLSESVITRERRSLEEVIRNVEAQASAQVALPVEAPPQQILNERPRANLEASALRVPAQQTVNERSKVNTWGTFPMRIARFVTRRPGLMAAMAAGIAVTIAGLRLYDGRAWETWGPKLWAYVTLASDIVKPYSEVLRPLHDIGVVTGAVVFGIYQFVTKRHIKHKLDLIQRAMEKGEDQPWLLERPIRRSETRSWFSFQKSPSDERDTKYVCIYNQKGGVGKTMLAMNLAAYLDRNNDVLLLDMDYQGSLSSAMLAACQIGGAPSQMNEIFEKDEKPDDIIDQATSLHWTHALIESERKEKLPRTSIITCHYPFLKLENQLTMKWLVLDNFRDIRYRIYDVVRSRAVRKSFDVVIFDCPPRLTMGSINALCASTHLLIPTILDSQSATAVDPTLQSLKEIKKKLNDDIKLLGVVGNRNSIKEDRLSEAEELAIKTVKEALVGAADTWGQGRLFQKTIPRRAAVTNLVGEDIPYLADPKFRKLFDQLGDEIADALNLRRSHSSTEASYKTINGSNGVSKDGAVLDRVTRRPDGEASLPNLN